MFAHTPHTEDYPFINLDRIGVNLKPEDFFGMNPICSLEQVTTVTENGHVGQHTLFTYSK